jgi:hypothetical protein
MAVAVDELLAIMNDKKLLDGCSQKGKRVHRLSRISRISSSKIPQENGAFAQ